ncbi:MAG: M20/M25/M40 family metallo-hydrolase [Planctomycetes bacterium]|nr:M20/M25/M40 family metallo-hydrolase [Planctomycetota bacterium]
MALHRKLISIFILYVNLISCSSAQNPDTSNTLNTNAYKSITTADLRTHVSYIASDVMKGRYTPSKELLDTARYISDRFKKLEMISPKGAIDYIQLWDYKGEKVPNCIGYIQGSDENLRNEYVVIGAHMDHLGIIMGEVVNGADDNASGTAGVLELAEAFSSLKEKPKRSVVFMTFGGEERGLLGSKYYVENPVLPLNKTVAMINMDMIGRSKDNYLFIGGVGTALEWKQMIHKYNDTYNFKLELHPGGTAPSDNSSFYAKSIPVLFFFTGIHDDYHMPGDDPDKINYKAQTNIVKMVFEIAYELVNNNTKLTFRESNESLEIQNHHINWKRLGIKYKREDITTEQKTAWKIGKENGAMKIGEIVSGKLAEKYGLKVGDYIITFDGKLLPPDPLDIYRSIELLVNRFENGRTFTIEVVRSGERKLINCIWEGK